MKRINFKNPIFIATVLLIIAFSPQLFLGHAFSNGDAVFSFYPGLSFYSDQLSSGGSFLWSNGILGGFSMYLDLLGGFFSPFNMFLFSNFSVVDAYNLAIMTGVALLFLFTYLLAREINISRAGSLLVAIIYSLGYQLAPWSNNITVINALFVLPMLLLGLNRFRRGQWWWIIASGLLTGYALLTGQPQWILLSFAGAMMYIVLLEWPQIKLRNFRSFWPLSFALLAIAIIGFLVASFQILPAQEIAKLSARSAGLSYNEAQIGSLLPFDFFWYLLPDLGFKYVNSQSPILYIGILPLFLAVIAMIRLRKDEYGRIFFWLFIFGLLISVKFSPFFWLIHQLPLFKYFRGAGRWMYIGTLGLAILAGLGLDFLRRDNISEQVLKKIKWILKLGIKILLLGVVMANVLYVAFANKLLAFFYHFFDLHFYDQTTRLPVEHYHNAIESIVRNNFWNINLLNARFVLAVVFMVTGYLVIKKIGVIPISKKMTYFVVGLSALNLLVFNHNYQEIIPRELVEKTPEIATFIIHREPNLDNIRYITVLAGSGVDQKLRTPHQDYTRQDQIEFERDILEININQLWNLDSMDGLNNLMPRRVARLLAILGSERATMGNSLAYADMKIDEKLVSITGRLNLLSMLNTKYLVSAYELPKIDDLLLIKTASSTHFNIPIYLYENKKVMPRIYFANSIEYIIDTDEEKNFKTEIESNTDYSKKTFIECSDCQEYRNLPSNEDKMDIKEYKDGYLNLNTQTEKGRWLIFSESNLPGWRITIDGQNTQSYMANYLFHGLYVPEGEHRVVFEYVGI